MVVSTAEQWLSLKSLLQDGSRNTGVQLTFSSLGSTQVCDMTLEGQTISLLYEALEQDMSEENIGQAIDGCFRSCKDGICTFLLLIQGGFYMKRERRMMEILQAHFGAEALKYLVVLSLENGKVADTLDDALLELINACDGRYSRIASFAGGDGLRPLLEMVDYMLTEHVATGYSRAMLREARRRSTDDSSMKMLKQKVREVEEKEQAFEELVRQQEERRAREVEELRARHAEERKKEDSVKKQFETRRESLAEAVVSHKATLQRQLSASEGETTHPPPVCAPNICICVSSSSKIVRHVQRRSWHDVPVVSFLLDVFASLLSIFTHFDNFSDTVQVHFLLSYFFSLSDF